MQERRDDDEASQDSREAKIDEIDAHPSHKSSDGGRQVFLCHSDGVQQTVYISRRTKSSSSILLNYDESLVEKAIENLVSSMSNIELYLFPPKKQSRQNSLQECFNNNLKKTVIRLLPLQCKVAGRIPGHRL